MAQLGKAFDSGQHDDMNSGFDPMPADSYMAKIIESDVKTTSKGTGKFIKLEFEVIQGEFKGRKFWTNINIINPNPVTVEIAEKELATICRACGKSVIQDTKELHGIPMKVKLKIKPAKGDYPAGNEPVGYSNASGQQAAADFVDESGDDASAPPAGDDDSIPWGE